jgi:hypothetical protein
LNKINREILFGDRIKTNKKEKKKKKKKIDKKKIIKMRAT